MRDDLIEAKICQFKVDILAHPTARIIQQYITHGNSFILEETPYFQLKEAVSKQFTVHPTDVFMVGSGKLGFSIKPSRRYQLFGEQSDIDLAIISKDIFESIWIKVFQYRIDAGTWWPKSDRFLKYLFNGWIRPDVLPYGNSFSVAKEWWDFFQELTNTGEYGNYNIRAGVYHSMNFFESYQGICIDQCKHLLE